MHYLTGLHSIEEHCRNPLLRGTIYYSADSKRIKQILEAAGKNGGCTAVRVDEEEITRRAGTDGHKGIVLAVETAERGAAETLEELIERTRGRESSILVVLDGITDPRNFGAILRSAEQFGADGVILQEKNSPRITPAVSQSSAGAEAYLSVIRTVNIARAVEALKKNGYWAYAADMDGTPAYRLDMRGKVVLVLGAEGGGVRKNVRDHCDDAAAVPMTGRLDSLNVAVTAGILLYEIRRQESV